MLILGYIKPSHHAANVCVIVVFHTILDSSDGDVKILQVLQCTEGVGDAVLSAINFYMPL